MVVRAYGFLTIAVLLVAMAAGGGARAEDPPVATGVATLHSTGAADNRVDLVIVSEGYTAAELPAFAEEVDVLVEAFLNEPPLSDYAGYFNIHRVDVPSAESGVDHDGNLVDTAFNGAHLANGLLNASIGIVRDVLGPLLGPDGQDQIVVLMNSPGGQAQAFKTGYLFMRNTQDASVLLHELGHSLGNLGDEYSTTTSCDPPLPEPNHPNVTAQTTLENIKWKHWIEPGTPIPTPGSSPTTVGLYEGATCPQHLYRSGFRTKMRVATEPYGPVNSEQLVLRIHDDVSPIDAVVPPPEFVVTTTFDGKRQLRVHTPTPAHHELEIEWWIDETLVGQGRSFVFDATVHGTGVQHVEVRVKDPTTWVREDPSGLLEDSRTVTMLQWAGACPGGSSAHCDDGNPCTVDYCDSGTGDCVYEPLHCDDGNACTADSCNPATGQCESAPPACADGDACSVDQCNRFTGECFWEPQSCDDASLCTTDSCDSALGCVYTPVTCDANACITSSSCSPSVGCEYEYVDCGDGDLCTDDLCDPVTGCFNAPMDCSDPFACTIDQCDPGTGTCLHEPTPVPDDGNDCTADLCSTTQGEQHVPFSCDDGNPCTVDLCNADACGGDPACSNPVLCLTTPLLCDDGDPGTLDYCTPASGCVFTPTACNDGVDNDGDGFVDYPADPECTGVHDLLETPSNCSDGIDNDGDGLIDYAPGAGGDPGCATAEQYSESNPACGFGFELVLLIPLWSRLRRARRGSLVSEVREVDGA